MSGAMVASATRNPEKLLCLVQDASRSLRRNRLDELYRITESALSEFIGFKLLTILQVQGCNLVRVHSNNLQKYPAGGAKPIAGDAWLERMLGEGVPAITDGVQQVRERFFDHEAIFALGCQSVLNVPVYFLDRSLGSVNLLDVAGHFEERHIRYALPFVHLLSIAWAASGGEFTSWQLPSAQT